MEVPTVAQRAKVIGYQQTKQFGTWKHGVLEHLLAEAAEVDPYSHRRLAEVDKEIDHIFPLSAAWDLGAYSWDASKRIQFANDPENLIVVSRVQNQAKSDHLPSEWLPSKRSARCNYAQRLTTIAHKYELPLPRKDMKVAERQCWLAY